MALEKLLEKKLENKPITARKYSTKAGQKPLLMFTSTASTTASILNQKRYLIIGL